MVRVAVVFFLLSLPLKAWAFGAIGHQQVCAAAYQLVSPATQQKIDALLTMGPEPQFSKGCVWPDEVKRQPAYQFTAVYHYLNVPRQQKTVQSRHCPTTGCLLSAIEHYAALIKHGGQTRLQAEALLFYSHLIADLHQPLHIAYADDLGGSKTALYYFGAPWNLHGVWDTAMLQSLGYQQNPELAFSKLSSQPQRTIQHWRSGQPLVWAQQSLDQTRKIYQHYKPGMLFSKTELQRDGPIIEERLLQAAVRLAWQLEQLLQPATVH